MRAEESLRRAVRDDFSSLLAGQERERVMGLAFNLLMSARDPRLLFDFDRLCEPFAAEVIPTEVGLDFENPTFFSPARCEVIGPE